VILELDRIVTAYGRSEVIRGVSLTVAPGEIVCLLGRNGAGKTTTLRSIMGLTPPRAGRIRFRGQDITRRPPYDIARLGISYVPDDRRIFPDLTVAENLEIGHRAAGRPGRWTAAEVTALFPALERLRDNRGSGLSGGEQKMLAIGRALMGNPELLILDEPSEGLSPLVVRDLVGVLRRILADGVTLLLADQNLKFARRLADRGYVLDKGTIQFEGTLEALWANEAVVRRYLAV
jgi:branched-chain amino acid transport system ATP-binding protein